MEEYFFYVVNSGWFSSLIGVLGLSYGIYSYGASRKGSRLSCYIFGLRLLSLNKSQFPAEMRVFYLDKEVNTLNKTKLVIWNDGALTIRGADVVQDDPIRLVFAPSSRILRLDIKSKTRPSNRFSASISDVDQNICFVNFEYMDPKDGVVIEILHTSEDITPKVEGVSGEFRLE